MQIKIHVVVHIGRYGTNISLHPSRQAANAYALEAYADLLDEHRQAEYRELIAQGKMDDALEWLIEAACGSMDDELSFDEVDFEVEPEDFPVELTRLIKAGQAVIENWERGDLASAVCDLDGALAQFNQCEEVTSGTIEAN